MIKTRKAQGLSLTTIIIAILVIIVLVVIVLIFTGKIGFFRESIDNCDGRCVATASECDQPGEIPIPKSPCKVAGYEASKADKYCCISTT